jgi:hypothetical protein
MSEIKSDRPIDVRKALDLAVGVLQEWRDEADAIVSVTCNMAYPCDQVIEHPSGWRESATRRLTVEIRLAGPETKGETP